MSKSAGILYIATEQPFISEAVESVKTVRRHSDLPIALLTDASLTDGNNTELEQFDEVIPIEDPYFDLRDKIYNIGKTPFNKTLYLDGDTIVVGNIDPVFDLLDRVDIAAAHATCRYHNKIDPVPDVFPELCTAVLAYKSNNKILNIFDKWERIHSIHHNRMKKKGGDLGRFGTAHGQPPFREALYSSDVSFSILPSEYNLQQDGRGYVYETPKILHGGLRHEMANHLPLSEKKVVFTGGQEINLIKKKIPILSPIATNETIKNVASNLGIYDKLKKIYFKLP